MVFALHLIIQILGNFCTKISNENESSESRRVFKFLKEIDQLKLTIFTLI